MWGRAAPSSQAPCPGPLISPYSAATLGTCPLSRPPLLLGFFSLSLRAKASVLQALPPSRVGTKSVTLGNTRAFRNQDYTHSIWKAPTSEMGLREREEGGPGWGRGGPTPTGPAQPHHRLNHGQGWVG